MADVGSARYFPTHALRHVRASLPDKVANTVACGTVISRLDYCKSLYAGTSRLNRVRLQEVLNTLAGVVAHRRKFDRITPALKNLHRLPVRSLAFRVQFIGQSSYLAPLIVRHVPSRDLHSASEELVAVLRTGTSLGDQAFSHMAPPTRYLISSGPANSL